MTTEILIVSVAMAIAAGLVGCFAVMRGMTLAADPLSHVALPGIGVALALHLNPVFGAVAALFFGVLLVWAVEERSREAAQTVIGVVFTAALALGSVMTSGEELIDALFGGAGTLAWPEIVFGVVASISVIMFIVTHRHGLVVMLVSPDLAQVAGVDIRRLNLLYLLTFALTIALGLRYLGVLLMGALIIISAVTARHLARGLNQMLFISVACAVIATVGGTALATSLQHQTGPYIVAVAAAGYVLSLLRRTT